MLLVYVLLLQLKRVVEGLYSLPLLEVLLVLISILLLVSFVDLLIDSIDLKVSGLDLASGVEAEGAVEDDLLIWVGLASQGISADWALQAGLASSCEISHFASNLDLTAKAAVVGKNLILRTVSADRSVATK